MFTLCVLQLKGHMLNSYNFMPDVVVDFFYYILKMVEFDINSLQKLSGSANTGSVLFYIRSDQNRNCFLNKLFILFMILCAAIFAGACT
jgi:hypothetical protein